MIGQTTSQCCVEKMSGGRIGVVFEAEHTRLHYLVALTFSPEEVSNKPQAFSSFPRGTQGGLGMNHPNMNRGGGGSAWM
jgi:hypothetical protein